MSATMCIRPGFYSSRDHEMIRRFLAINKVLPMAGLRILEGGEPALFCLQDTILHGSQTEQTTLLYWQIGSHEAVPGEGEAPPTEVYSWSDILDPESEAGQAAWAAYKGSDVGQSEQG